MPESLAGSGSCPPNQLLKRVVCWGEAPPQPDAAGGSGCKFHPGEVGGVCPSWVTIWGPWDGLGEGHPQAPLGRPGQGAGVRPVRQGHTWAVQGVHGSDERDPIGVGKCQQRLQHP